MSSKRDQVASRDIGSETAGRSGTSPEASSAGAPRVGQWLDALAYSSLLAASVAGALATAATLAFELPLAPFAIALAVSGTLVVYNVDRLRDLEHDRPLAPLRSAFVDLHQKRLRFLTLGAAVTSGLCALRLAPAVWGLCGVVLTLGLLHRRLKHIRGIKTLYLTLAWLAVVLGLPLLGPGRPPQPGSVYWVFAIIGFAILSNLLASNLDRRRAEENQRHLGSRSRLGITIAAAGLGVVAALIGPEALRSLVLIPLAELLVLCRFREGEHYALVVVDGALFAGACGTITLLALS